MRARYTLAFLALAIASSASAGELYACVSIKTGSMRMVASPGGCIAGKETVVAWNTVGPEGRQGEQGLPGEQGPPGLAGPVLRVIDANGNSLGIFVDVEHRELPRRAFLVYNEEVGALMYVDLSDGAPVPGFEQTVYFESGDCTGQAYVVNSFIVRTQLTPREWSPSYFPFDGPFHFFAAVKGAPAEERTMRSSRAGGPCGGFAVEALPTLRAVPAEDVTDRVVVPSPPLRVVPSS